MSNQILVNGQPHQFINGQLQAAELPSGKKVTITPAIVEIATLRVSNKQITQALIKQFPEAKAFDENGNPQGNLWGKVRYQFGDFTQDDGHHILFEKGGKLYRDWFSPGKEHWRSIPNWGSRYESSWNMAGMLILTTLLTTEVPVSIPRSISKKAKISFADKDLHILAPEGKYKSISVWTGEEEPLTYIEFDFSSNGYHVESYFRPNTLSAVDVNINQSSIIDPDTAKRGKAMIKKFWCGRYQNLNQCIEFIEHCNWTKDKYFTWDGLDKATSTVDSLEQLFIAV